MRKLRISITGVDDDFNTLPEGYENSRTLQRSPRWDFLINPTLECIFINKRKVTSQFGEQSVYEVLHLGTKSQYHFFGSSVLNDRMSIVKPLQKICIVFQGQHKQKRYKMFTVGIDPTFKFVALEWPEIQIEESPARPVSNAQPAVETSTKQTGATSTQQAGITSTTQVSTTAKQASASNDHEFEEPPF